MHYYSSGKFKMIKNEIYERPKCENCGEVALGIVKTTWLCGKCMVKYNNIMIQETAKKNEVLNKLQNDKEMP